MLPVDIMRYQMLLNAPRWALLELFESHAVHGKAKEMEWNGDGSGKLWTFWKITRMQHWRRCTVFPPVELCAEEMDSAGQTPQMM